MDYLNLLAHLALLFLWCRIWTDDDRNFFFNPLISGPTRVVDRVLGVLRMPLPFLPNRVLAALALIGALALKALVVFSKDIHAVQYGHLLAGEIFAFLIFTFQIATINALLCLMSPRRAGRAGQVADLLARPVGWIRPVPLQLLVVPAGIFLCSVLSATAINASLYWLQPQTLQIFLTKASFVATILIFLNTLLIWSQLTLLAILSSWLGLIMPRSPIAVYGREFCSLLLGRFNGLLVVGMMDLTPLLFFLVIGWLHEFLIKMVSQLL